MLAEGMDFFTPTDHDFLTDYPADDRRPRRQRSHLRGDRRGDHHLRLRPLQRLAAHHRSEPGQRRRRGPRRRRSGRAGLPDRSATTARRRPRSSPWRDHAAAGRDDRPDQPHPQPLRPRRRLRPGDRHRRRAPPQSGVPAAAHRLDPSVTNFFTDTFDALEIWIGDNRQQIYDNFLGEVTTGNGGNIGDWFNMLNQGIIRTGVADSDTHKRIISQSGVPAQHGRLPGGRPGPARPPRRDAVVHRQRRPYHRHQRPHGARDGVRVVHRRERRPRPGPLHRRRRLHGRRRLPALHGRRAVRRRRKLHGAAADDRDHGRQRRHRRRHPEPRVGGVRHRRVLRQPHHHAPHLDEQADRRRPDQRQAVRDHAGLRARRRRPTSPSRPLR